MASLQRGIVEYRLAAGRDGREHLEAAQAAFDEAIVRAPDDWPWPWYGLALVDWALEDGGYVVKPTLHQPAGVYHRAAAMRALAKALEADPDFAPAAALLAKRMLARGDPDLDRQVTAAIRSAVAADSLATPEAWLVYGRMQRSLGHADSACTAFRSYATTGGDTAVSLLEQSRCTQDLGDTLQAARLYLAGAEHTQGADGRAAYRRDISWVADSAELSTFDSLDAAGIAEWVRDFWLSRDARELRPPGARLREHLRRWNFVHRAFRMPTTDPDALAALGRRQSEPVRIAFSDPVIRQRDGGRSELSLADGVMWLPAMELIPSPYLDDRARIYMRHGEPDQIVTNAGKPGRRSPLSWAYSSTTGRLSFHFACSSYCVLRPWPLSMSYEDPGLMAIDARWEILKGQLRAGHPSRILLRKLSTAVVKDIATGLSTDGFPAEFKHQLAPEAQFYALGAGSGHVLAVFALPGERLTGVPLDGGAMGYPVTLRLIATNASGDVVRLDTLRNFRSAASLGEGQFLFGLSQLTLPAGTWDVRLLVTQPDADAGGAIGRLGITIPATNALALSDLVLGRAGSGLEWRGPNGLIHLSPLDNYNREGEVEVYYELSGTTANTDYRTEVKLEAVYGDAEGDLQLGFSDRAAGPLLVSRRTISLENLEPGQYRLSVAVTEQPSGRTATQTRLLNVAGR